LRELKEKATFFTQVTGGFKTKGKKRFRRKDRPLWKEKRVDRVTVKKKKKGTAILEKEVGIGPVFSGKGRKKAGRRGLPIGQADSHERKGKGIP